MSFRKMVAEVVLIATAVGAVSVVASPPAPAAVSRAVCQRTSVGFLPLTQLGTGTYEGSMGGLYPGGTNRAPARYVRAGNEARDAVVPRNHRGRPSPRGKLALVSIGMSNTTMEFSAFERLVGEDRSVNRHVVLVDGAQGGEAADRWLPTDASPWRELDQRLDEANVSRKQVQAIWLKQADRDPTTTFTEYVTTLEQQMASIVQIATNRFPKLRQVFVSPRIYAGYSDSKLNPEPYAYWSGFAAQGLVAMSVQHPKARPWVGWGPYLWADGTTPNPDGLTWTCADLGPDGTHPSTQGQAKVATLLQSFFLRSQFTKWFRAGKAAARR